MQIMTQGLAATIIGMGTVFFVLSLLMLVLFGFKYIAPQSKKPEKVLEPVTAEPEIFEEVFETSETDDLEVIAVISAAIAAYMGDESGYRISSVTKVQENVRGRMSAWNQAGRRENHRGIY